MSLKMILFMLLSISVLTMQGQEESREVRVMNFDELQPFLHQNNDTVYLVNFWATWCAPCRKEMPAIQAVEKKYAGKNFKVILVSLDFPAQLESTLIPYLKSNQIKSEVILLNDPDQNRWIDLVDKSWSGEIPYTLIYSKDFRESYTNTFTFEELDSIINNKLNSL